MTSIPRAAIAAVTLLFAMAAVPASAQKQGGVLRMYNPDSPASMSILEEATVFAEGPMMGVFNNLVMYDQHVKQNSLQSVVPDLATAWSWSEDGTELTCLLRGNPDDSQARAGHACLSYGRPPHSRPDSKLSDAQAAKDRRRRSRRQRRDHPGLAVRRRSQQAARLESVEPGGEG
jgi:hypothetical protein